MHLGAAVLDEGPFAKNRMSRLFLESGLGVPKWRSQDDFNFIEFNIFLIENSLLQNTVFSSILKILGTSDVDHD